MYKPYTLTIDVTSQKEPPLVHFNQEDHNTAKLIVQLREGANILPLVGASARIVVQKLDNTGGFLQCDITDANNGIVEVVLSSNSLAYPGQVMCEIHITKGDKNLVTPRFKYVVGKSLLNSETLESTNEYPFLKQLVVDGKNAKKDFDTALIEVDKKTNEAVAAANNKFSTALTTIVANAEKETVKAQSQLNGIVKDAQKVVDDAKSIDMPFLKKSEDEMKGLRKDVTDTNKRMDNLVTNGNKDNTEVVDARLGSDGIARGSAGTLVREIHKQQLDSERKLQVLQHGLNVLNAPVASPLSLEIQGRTLVNLLGQTNLDNTKYYVFVPHKGTTKITYGGNTYEGVTKFTGQATVAYTIKQDLRGKIARSTVENGHSAKTTGSKTTLVNPTDNLAEAEGEYPRLFNLNGAPYFNMSATVNGGIAQQLFPFNIIRTLEDKFGSQIWQRKTVLADKIAIAKQVITKLTCNWYGFGSSPAGNKANLSYWNNISGSWGTSLNHNASTVDKITQTSTNMSAYIDSNGFVNFLVYAEPSNGSVSSVINTDYIELGLEVNVSLPFLEDALYEVDQATYNKINVDPEYSGQKLLDKFPYIQDVQHVNPVVVVEGGNLFPPFTEWSTRNATVEIVAPYKIKHKGGSIECFIQIKVLPNTTYTASIDMTGNRYQFYSINAAGVRTYLTGIVNPGKNSIKVTTLADTFLIEASCYATANGDFEFNDPMLVLGDKPQPFAPRNPSYLYTNTVLAGQNGVNDVLYQEDGQWKVLRKWERDVVLEDLTQIAFADTYSDFRRYTYYYSDLKKAINRGYVIKNDKSIIQTGITHLSSNTCSIDVNAGIIYVSISNNETGFGTYNPTQDEVRAFFNGWKVKTSDANGKPIAWKSVVDDKDAPTQTLAYVKANRAPNYTPYKITYQLATPRVEVVQVEGGLAISGMTQVNVDSGVVVREQIVPVQGDNNIYVNYFYINTINQVQNPDKQRLLKNKAVQILAVYKNGSLDVNWSMQKGYPSFYYGGSGAYIDKEKFNPKAEYTVTYLVQDKHLFTTNPVDVKVTYNQSVRSTIEEVTVKQSDAATSISILQNIMTDVLARLKANSL
ncbi:phage baseplate upper protein [Bacillus mobilis]|uniref:phage baseplate upper protein n=1 Tax=Bacillus mobilis TaxID=2026190 RepID=UPI0021D0E267|nr:phage baseplate upper protein [Bacillus mobilis]MCU5196505.1 phage baseplate upper protein [Bacillus mobilis]